MGAIAMFVAFNKDVPGQGTPKAGTVSEFPDAIGRAYVDGGYGTETDAMTVLRAEQAARYAEMETRLTKAITDAVKPAKSSPPAYRGNPDGSLEIEGIERGGLAQGEIDARGRKADRPTLGDITRLMYWQSAWRTQSDERITEGMARYADQKIKAWKLERSQWRDNSEAHVSADNPGGVARDGAESTGGAAVYGYLVRPEYVGDVFRIEAETDVMVGLKQIPVGRGVEVHYPALDQYSTTTPTRTSNIFAGVVLSRKAEDVARAEVDSKMSEIEFKITDLTGLTKLSRDLMADAFIDINSYLQDLFRAAFGWRRDWDYINGTGVGEPTGILNATSLISGGGKSGNTSRTTATDIRYEDLAWMISKMWPACRRGAYWICNAQATRVLQSVQDTATTARYVYQPNALVSQSMVPSVISGPGDWAGVLMGFPVKLSEKVPALGTTGDLTLFSPTYYGEAQRAGLEVGISEHRYFETDQVGIRWKMRNDAKSMFRKYITGADGNTYTNIVTLAVYA